MFIYASFYFHRYRLVNLQGGIFAFEKGKNMADENMHTISEKVLTCN